MSLLFFLIPFGGHDQLVDYSVTSAVVVVTSLLLLLLVIFLGVAPV